MAGGIVLFLAGLWVVLQSTKGPLVSKLGLSGKTSSPSSTKSKATTTTGPAPSSSNTEPGTGPLGPQGPVS